MQPHSFGFRFGPSPNDSDNPRYASYFWQSIRGSIYLNLRDPHSLNLVAHYQFATRSRGIGHDEYDALVTAMHAARAAFLQDGIPSSKSDHDLRAALKRSSDYRYGMDRMSTQQVARALYDEVKSGNIIYVPDQGELRACVRAIMEDRKKPRPSRGAARSARSISPAEVLYGNAPRIAPAPVRQFIAEEAGPDVNALVAKSPGLQDDLKTLGDAGWEIQYGKAGGGSYADRKNSVIVLDSNLKGHSVTYTQVLSHEVGHATYSFQPDYSSRTAYVQSTLHDEAAATMNNIRVQREILSNKGIDIGIAGGNYSAYNRAYDVYLKDGDAAACRDTIGAAFGNEITSTSGQTYNDYYGAAYDQANPPGR